jgi:hypothetical protein
MGAHVKVEPLIGRDHPFVEENPDLKLRYNACTPRGSEILAAAEALYGREAFLAHQQIPTMILPVILWSDACEPANSKQNRGSVQVFLATVGFHEEDAHSGETTFLLAIGPHSAETDDVEELFYSEMKMLSRVSQSDNLYYYGAARRVVRIYCQIYSILQDRIERQASARVLAGNSNVTARWGWLGALGEVTAFFPSCSMCYDALLANQDYAEQRAESNCCANWRMEGLTYPPPKDYPLELITTEPPSLPFLKNTFESMSEACDFCFLQVSHGTWTGLTAKSYLNTKGVIPAYANSVVTAGLNSFMLSQVEQATARYRLLLHRSLQPNTKFPVHQPAKPITWQFPNVSLLESVDVVMHLLFLGIVATILREAYFRWLRVKHLMSSFSKSTRTPLKQLEDLHLSWCKIQPINASGTLSNHVSENFLAFARIGKWLFGCASILRPDDITYVDPNIAPAQFNIGQIRRWFKERDLPLERGLSHQQIKERFLATMATPGGPPPIPEKGEAGITEETLHDLMETMVSMVAHVMVERQVSEEDCLSVERHVKMFLGAFEKFDKPRRDAKDACPSTRPARTKTKATWISKMNFVSLLNLPDVLRRYGSLRALWEGDRKGEGGLPKVKAKVKGGTKGNWAATAATAILCDTALERVIKAAANSVKTDSMDPSIQQLVDGARLITGEGAHSKYKNYVSYADVRTATAAMLSGEPVSLVLLESGSYGMMTKNTLTFVPIVLKNGETAKVICGASYMIYECQAAMDLAVPLGMQNESMEKQKNSLVAKYILLLPELNLEHLPFTGYHHFLTSDWEEMTSLGNIERCRVSKATY